ncbi:hypothetical protein IIB51_01705 [Patescibacteria group bacterium]|nr:hypothetical protein [Patescibacteria group bacterium]
MEELVKSDIFFFITGAAVVLLTLVVLVALYYIVRILRNIFSLSEAIEEEGEEIVKDISKLRRGLEKGGRKIRKIIKKASPLPVRDRTQTGKKHKVKKRKTK